MGEELSAPVERRRLECVRRCSCPRAKVGGGIFDGSLERGLLQSKRRWAGEFLGELLLLDVVF